MPQDIGYWLARKYAILAQQADATTRQASAATQNAATNALTGRAAAMLDTTRARLLPAESEAQVGQTQANTRLIDEQSKVVGPESQARIAQIGAETGYTRTQDKVLQREGLMERRTLPASLQSVLGARGYTGYSLDEIIPERRRQY